MKMMLAILSLVTLATLTHAAERDEAWVSKARFDGQFYTYELVGYGFSEFTEQRVVKCNYGYFGKDRVLKSIDFKLFISGDSQTITSRSVHNGKIDVGAAVQACVDADKGVNKVLETPVAFNFPKLSGSSRLTAYAPPKSESLAECVARVNRQCQGSDYCLFYQTRQCGEKK